ncbi:MAG: DCC1-like thiol-disulfide oxidoreductase family protein [Planctomycetaceae bacterium]
MTETSATAANSTTKQTGASSSERIVFFDGVCGLCNHTVDFLLRKDVAGLLRFAPLQGTTAAKMLPAKVRDRLDTIAYYRDGQRHYRSAAVLWVLRDLGGSWGRLGRLLLMIPGPIRDIGYRCVSRCRYRIFGKHEACRIPTAEERGRFLD